MNLYVAHDAPKYLQAVRFIVLCQLAASGSIILYRPVTIRTCPIMSVQISNHIDIVDAHLHNVIGRVAVPQNRHVLNHP